MGELLAPKRERFARLLANEVSAGLMTGVDALKKAGFTAGDANSATSAVAMLKNSPDIIARVDELQHYNKELLEVNDLEVLRELRYLAFSNMGDYVNVDAEGTVTVKQLTDLTRQETAAIQELVTEVTTTTRGHGAEREEVTTTRTRIRMYDKRAALVDLGRTVGLFTKKHLHEHRGIILNVTPQDMAV